MQEIVNEEKKVHINPDTWSMDSQKDSLMYRIPQSAAQSY